MKRVMIVGAGGVGRVVAHKCAQNTEVFSDIMLASRTLARCEEIRDEVSRPIEVAQVDADDVKQLTKCIWSFSPDILINVALPYQDLNIMDACLETGTHYVDTANYEPRDEARFCYQWQWDYHERFRKAGLMALLGSGFDPGVTNVFTAYVRKHLLDRIDLLDIVDCNAGSHGMAFATNFNPEINIREVTAAGRYFENGEWREVPALSVTKFFHFPEGIGDMKIYLLYHEELESLAKHFPEAKRMRFWMTFSDQYLTHLRVLENVGMTSIEPVDYEGKQIVPLQFLKAVLPDPGSLGSRTKGRTCIGVVVSGVRAGASKRIFVYNISDHEAAFAETNSQAISYTTGVPAMIGAMMMATGKWSGQGVFNMEQFDPDPFMEQLSRFGLPWVVKEDAEVPALD